jgi:CPA2 family monovalent cation:H+ antiporter-2
MLHHTPLVATIVAGIVLAFLFGAVAHRLRASPLIGYLLAGVAVGPFTPGYVADQELATELAEIGVILLMFGVGLHFSWRDLMSVKSIAIPGALLQIGTATLLGLLMGHLLGWTIAAGLVFGLALSVASTVVLIRAMQERRLLDTERGHIAVGWLVVEDLVMVLALVLVPALATLGEQGFSGSVASTLGWTVAKVAAFGAVMLIIGGRVIPWVLHWVAHGGSRELFRLAVLAIALGTAFGAAMLFGVSFALGAFFAGMVLSESELSQRAAEETLPLRDAFAVLFFVSVGMLFDPAILAERPAEVLATILIIVVGKSVAAFGIVRLFGYGNRTALTISASLAQIGEFSFILAGLGVGLNLLPAEGQDLILAGALLSILLNPFVFRLVDIIREPIATGDRASMVDVPVAVAPAAPVEVPPSVVRVDGGSERAAQRHVVVVGFGKVGRMLGEQLCKAGVRFVAIDTEAEKGTEVQENGGRFVVGNATDPIVLAEADIAGARLLFAAVPDPFEGGQIVEQARGLNPALTIIARANSDAQAEHLAAHGAHVTISGEREIALRMAELALGRVPSTEAAA